MRSVISSLHWFGEAFNVSTMTFEGLSDFPKLVFCIDDSTIADINGARPIEGSI